MWLFRKKAENKGKRPAEINIKIRTNGQDEWEEGSNYSYRTSNTVRESERDTPGTSRASTSSSNSDDSESVGAGASAANSRGNGSAVREREPLDPVTLSNVSSPGFSTRAVHQARSGESARASNLRTLLGKGSGPLLNKATFSKSPNGNLKWGQMPVSGFSRSKNFPSPPRTPSSLPGGSSPFSGAKFAKIFRGRDDRRNGLGTIFVKMAPVDLKTYPVVPVTPNSSGSGGGENGGAVGHSGWSNSSPGLGGTPQGGFTQRFSRMWPGGNNHQHRGGSPGSGSRGPPTTGMGNNVLEALQNRKRGRDMDSSMNQSITSPEINVSRPGSSTGSVPGSSGMGDQNKFSKRPKYVDLHRPLAFEHFDMQHPTDSKSILEQMNQTEKRFLPDSSHASVSKRTRFGTVSPRGSSSPLLSGGGPGIRKRKGGADISGMGLVEADDEDQESRDRKWKTGKFCHCNECYAEAAGITAGGNCAVSPLPLKNTPSYFSGTPTPKKMVHPTYPRVSPMKTSDSTATCEKGTETEMSEGRPEVIIRKAEQTTYITKEKYEYDRIKRLERFKRILGLPPSPVANVNGTAPSIAPLPQPGEPTYDMMDGAKSSRVKPTETKTNESSNVVPSSNTTTLLPTETTSSVSPSTSSNIFGTTSSDSNKIATTTTETATPTSTTSGETPKPPPFNFGSNDSTVSKPGAVFGADTTSAPATVTGSTTISSPSPAAVGSASASTSGQAAKPFTFGTFGSQDNAASTSTPVVGAATTSAPATVTGATTISTPIAVGNTTDTSASTSGQAAKPFTFGTFGSQDNAASTTTTSTPIFGGGVTTSAPATVTGATTIPSPSPVATGNTSQSTSGEAPKPFSFSAFGSQSQGSALPTSTPAFGATTVTGATTISSPSPSAFGNTSSSASGQAPKPFQFGSQNNATSTTTPVFGTPTTSASAIITGATTISSPSPAPATFGNTSLSTSGQAAKPFAFGTGTFGSQDNNSLTASTPVFGTLTTSASAPVTGATTISSPSPVTFGSTNQNLSASGQAPKPFTFGTFGNQDNATSTSVFGPATTSAPAAITATTTSSSPFVFGNSSITSPTPTTTAPTTGSGFPFGSASNSSASPFQFGGASTATTTAGTSTPFQLGGTGTSSATSSTPFQFGGSTNATSSGPAVSAAPTPFQFGSTPAPASNGFGFGSQSTTANPSPFGGPPASQTASNTGFAFGQSATTTAPQASSNTGFGFGQSTPSSLAPQSASNTGFGFGQSTTSSLAPQSASNTGFAFGQSTTSNPTPQAPSNSGFAFGQSTTSNSTPVFGQTSAPSVSAPAPAGVFQFGGVPAPAAAAPSGVFQFGGVPSQVAAPAASPVFQLGTTPAPQASPGGFNFAAAAAANPNPFGNQQLPGMFNLGQPSSTPKRTMRTAHRRR